VEPLGRARRQNQPVEWEKKRDHIVARAAELFARQGVDGVSMRDIGRNCGLHVSSIYHYFPSKELIYEAVRQWAVISTTEVALDSLVGDTPAKRLEAFVRALTRHFMEDQPQMRILEREVLHLNASNRPPLKFPAISNILTGRLTEDIEALKPSLLNVLGSARTSELIWDVAWGVTRYSPAHALASPTLARRHDIDTIADEVWMLISKLLDIPLGT